LRPPGRNAPELLNPGALRLEGDELGRRVVHDEQGGDDQQAAAGGDEQRAVQQGQPQPNRALPE
jgi:hypothetical protein